MASVIATTSGVVISMAYITTVVVVAHIVVELLYWKKISIQEKKKEKKNTTFDVVMSSGLCKFGFRQFINPENCQKPKKPGSSKPRSILAETKLYYYVWKPGKSKKLKKLMESTVRRNGKTEAKSKPSWDYSQCRYHLSIQTECTC